MKTNFIKAFIGTCSGTAIFERLRFQHGFRTFLHLLLMNLICAVIISLGVFPEWNRQAAVSVDRVYENCGSLKLGENGIFPEKEPEKVKNFLIAGPMSVTYLPEDVTVLPENFDQGCLNGILWSGKHIAAWRKTGDASYRLTLLGNAVPAMEEQSVSPEEIPAKLREAQPVKLPQGEEQSLNHSKLMALCKLMLFMVMLFMALFTLAQIIIYIAMFAGVFALMGLGRPRRFKVGEVVKLAVYAGFPAMLVGSVASALRLPMLDFNMIYVLGMTVYLMIIMNRLDRLRQEREWHDNGSPDNDRMA